MPEIDQLLEQLTSEDANTRVMAAKQLGDLDRPEAIPQLVTAYRKDADKKVREAAAAALHNYRALEARLIPVDESAGISPGAGRLRLLLIVLLVLTILVNGGLFAIRNLGLFSGGGVAPTAAGLGRDGLTAIFQQRITDAEADVAALRKYYTGVQGGGNLACADADMAAIKLIDPTTISDSDAITYPDMGPLNTKVNDMATHVNGLRQEYLDLCGLKNTTAIKDKINGLPNGAAQLVLNVDDVTRNSVKATRNALTNAIAFPAATVTPTFTPTALPTDTFTPTVPTDTPAPTIPGAMTAPTRVASPAKTASVQPGPTTAGAASGVPATLVPTTAAPTMVNSIPYDLSALGLNTMATYGYRIVVRYEANQPDGTVINGSFQDIIQAQTSPTLATQIELNVTEGTLPGDFASPLKKPLGPLYVFGNSTYIVANNKLYQYGAILGQRASLQCQAQALAPAVLAKINAVNAPKIFSRSDNLTLTRQMPDVPVNNYTTTHYQVQVENKAISVQSTIDLYLSQEAKPIVIRITDQEIYNYRNASGTLTPSKYITVTSTYDLLKRDNGVQIVVPDICKGK